MLRTERELHVSVINKCRIVINTVVFQKHEWELESELTRTQHVTHTKDSREVETTLALDTNWSSDWMSLPTHSAEQNARWKVWFRCLGDDIVVVLKCESLDRLYTAASVRLSATVVNDCDNWTETTDVVSSDNKYNYRNKFPKRLSEFGESAQVHIRVRWTPIELSPHAVSYLTSGTARVQCRWWLSGLSTVRPTAENWMLRSEPFGDCGVWRMAVSNRRTGSSRELQVGVWLQYICEEV